MPAVASPQPSGPATTSGIASGSLAAARRRRFLRGSSVPTNSTKRSGRRYRSRSPATAAHDAGAWSTPSGTTRIRAASTPLASRSRRLASLDVITIAALSRVTSRLRRITRRPWRLNRDGSARNARSCIVTTSGAAVAHGTRPVAWATSTRPVTCSTRGRRRRSHDSYSNGRGSGSWATGIGARHAGVGARRWRPATPTRVTSWRGASRLATSIAATAVPPGASCQHCSSV